jgi:hypothetical protein
MELFLNILWVLMASGILAIWRMRWVRQKRGAGRDALQECTALVCGLVLLFFAVSLSDDLHSEIVLIEESSASRRHAACLTDAHHSPQSGTASHAAGPAVLPFVTRGDTLCVVHRVIQVEPTCVSFLQSSSSFGRAPPAFSL